MKDDEKIKMFSFKIPKELHKDLKYLSVYTDKPMKDLIVEMIDNETTNYFKNIQKEEGIVSWKKAKETNIKNQQLINV